MIDHTAERALAARLRAGEPAAAAELDARYRPALQRYLLRLCGDAAKAEDFAQDALLKAWQHAGARRDDLRLQPWVYRIALNVFRDDARYWRVRPRTVSLEATDVTFAAADEVPPLVAEIHAATTSDPRDDPEGQTLRREDAAAVHAVLARLAPIHRDVLTLHYLHGWSYEELAARLATTVSAVKSRLLRGRALFAAQWGAPVRVRPLRTVRGPRRRAGQGRGVTFDRKSRSHPWRAQPWDPALKECRRLGNYATEAEALAVVAAWRAQRSLELDQTAA